MLSTIRLLALLFSAAVLQLGSVSGHAPLSLSADGAGTTYLVGIGKADMTGPAADVNMMGYAMPQQIARGIRARQYARAFLFSDGLKSVLFVNLDACMASQALYLEVVKRLEAEYGDLYSSENVAISGVHTHSAPAGYLQIGCGRLQYTLYSITSLGFVRETFDAHVSGIMRAVARAHDNTRPSTLAVAQDFLLGANVNRSPSAYANNPADERARYAHDVDKLFTGLFVFENPPESGAPVRGGAPCRVRGLVTWFAVHCTSLNNTNSLISGDNKGTASLLLEHAQASAAPHPELTHDVVAAFGQSNVGDTSPNTLGAFCGASAARCDEAHSTCGGRNEPCHGRGPAWPDDVASNNIIARAQADAALAMARNASGHAPVAGPVDFRHTFLDMTNLEVRAEGGRRAGRTCPAAMGYSFAAGTTDGPGAFDFKQGDTNGTAFWRFVSGFIHAPSAEQIACQAPKPVLLDTGPIEEPYLWQPRVVPISLLRIGNVAIACVPGEFTSMAGRRLRDLLHSKLRHTLGPDTVITIAGLCNTYSSYVATYEEYQVQRYEGASTIYGPHTLDAYLQEFEGLAGALARGEPAPAGPRPPDLLPDQLSFLPPVVLDQVPAGAAFGAVVPGCDARAAYHHGDTVRVTFRAACPRNNVRLEGTFLEIQRRVRAAAANGTAGRALQARASDAPLQQLAAGSTETQPGLLHAHNALQSDGPGGSGRVSAEGSVGARAVEPDGSEWETVRTDTHLDTVFRWRRPWELSTYSYATVDWVVGADVPPGTYRVRYLGTAKVTLGRPWAAAKYEEIAGVSSEFEVKAGVRSGHGGADALKAHDDALANEIASVRELGRSDQDPEHE